MSVVDVKSLEREHAKIEARKRNERVIETAREVFVRMSHVVNGDYHNDVEWAFRCANDFEKAADERRIEVKP